MDQKKAQKPTISPGFISFVTNAWLTPFVFKASKKSIESEDLYQLADKDKSFMADKRLDFYQKAVDEHSKDPSKSLPNLAIACIQIVIAPLTGALVSELIEIAANIFSAIVLGNLVEYAQTGSTDGLLLNSGLGLAFLLFGLQVINAFCSSATISFKRRVEVIERCSLTSQAYRKSLRLSLEAREKFPEGDILTLLTGDIPGIVTFVPDLIEVVVVPMQLIAILILLWKYLGWSLLVSIAVFGITTGSSSGLGSLLGKFYGGVFQAAGKRTQILREYLYSVKIVKLRAMETWFHEKISKARQLELARSRTLFILMGGLTTLNSSGLIMAMIAGFATYGAVGNRLDASVIFPAISLFNQLKAPMESVGGLIQIISQFKVSAGRVAELLAADAVQDCFTKNPSENAVDLKNVSFTFSTTSEDLESPPVKALDLSIPKGALVGIVGPVGGGKSTLLSGIISEARLLAGSININGDIAYCAQQPWIMAGSIKNNILMGQEEDPRLLDEAVKKSGLTADLQILSGGIFTEIGEGGVNLSGGQRARVALARALYKKADILLLDDPLAALDAHVGREVFENALVKKQAAQTVLLVTHQLQYLHYCDLVIVMEGGSVVQSGSYEELVSIENGTLKRMMADLVAESISTSETTVAEVDEPEVQAATPEAPEGDDDPFVVKEDLAKGHVVLNVYANYIKAMGFILPFLFLVALVVHFLMLIGTPLVLTAWTNNEQLNDGDATKSPDSYYLTLYVIGGVVLLVSGFTFHVLGIFATLAASKKYHDSALARLMTAPIHFFNSNPVGRVLNRMTSDVRVMDGNIMFSMITLLMATMTVLTSIVLVSQVNWFFLLGYLLLGALAVMLFRFYQAANLALKRLTSVLKSPFDSHISESLTGLSTIRAHRLELFFMTKEQELLDDYQAVTYMYESLMIWMNLRLALGTSLITLAIALFACQSRNIGSAAFSASIGLALAYGADAAANMTALLLAAAHAEANMNSVERLHYYGNNIKKEALAVTELDNSLPDWPVKGEIVFNQVQVAYPSKPNNLVIKDLSVHIKPTEKIGVVGRTGSGKSTIAMALFRLLEPVGGSIEIDGVDILKIGLKKLRSNLEMIPQEPILFEGTVRSNLDYLGQFNDEQLWNSLEYSGLKEYVSQLEEKLDAPISANGENLSVGQRQLFCLSRAILANPKILVLDEATASVDNESDRLIQLAIKKHFANSTVISIAHRLNTIADFDKVIVLDAGELKEFGEPFVLLQNENSLFSSLVQASGEANAELIKSLAKAKYEGSM